MTRINLVIALILTLVCLGFGLMLYGAYQISEASAITVNG